MTIFNRRDFVRLGASTMVAGLAGKAAVVSASPAKIDTSIIDHVDPELRSSAMQMLKAAAFIPPISDKTLSLYRRADAFSPKLYPDVPYRKVQIPGPQDSPWVTIYVINERADGSRPAILHTHGGGFVTGSAAQSVSSMQEYAKALDCVIVTVDYRLAPETTYIGSIEDNYAGLRWLYTNAEQIGADRKRIAVMGESAGGGHAALLAITARDRGEIPLIYQCLTYPMLDDRTASSRKVAPTVGKIAWSAANNLYGWHSFLGQRPGTSRVPSRAVPARVSSIKGLPPAFIGVGTIDLFVEEDITYAQRLIDAGVSAELIVVPGAYHGFDGNKAKSIAQRFNAIKMDALRRALNATA